MLMLDPGANVTVLAGIAGPVCARTKLAAVVMLKAVSVAAIQILGRKIMWLDMDGSCSGKRQLRCTNYQLRINPLGGYRQAPE
jgi:hypothetical protein